MKTFRRSASRVAACFLYGMSALGVVTCGAPTISLEGLPCPCTAGFACCNGQCQASGLACEKPASGDAGAGDGSLAPVTPADPAELVYTGRAGQTVVALNQTATTCANGKAAQSCPATLDFGKTSLDQTTQTGLATWFASGRVLVSGVLSGDTSPVLTVHEIWVSASGNAALAGDVYFRMQDGAHAQRINVGAEPETATLGTLPVAGTRESTNAVDTKARALAQSGDLIVVGAKSDSSALTATDYFAKLGVLDQKSLFVWVAGDDSSIYTLSANADLWSPPDPCILKTVGPCLVNVCSAGPSFEKPLDLGAIELVDPQAPNGLTSPLVKIPSDGSGVYNSATLSVPWLASDAGAPRTAEYVITGGPDLPTEATVLSVEPGRITVSGAPFGTQTTPTHVAGADLVITWTHATAPTDQVEFDLTPSGGSSLLLCFADASAGQLVVPFGALDAVLDSQPAYVWMGTMTGASNQSTITGLNLLGLTFRDATAGYIAR